MSNLRILIKKYPEPTREQCDALMAEDKSILTISQAYSKLKKPTEQHLQYLDAKENVWYNVPVVVEEMNA